MGLKTSVVKLASKLPRRAFWSVMSLLRPPVHWGDDMAVWKRNLPFELDQDFAVAFAESIAYAPRSYKDMDIRWRTHTACWAAAVAMKLDGDLVECGVNTGVLAGTICRYLRFNESGKKFFLFDTYEGMPLDLATQKEQAKFGKGENPYSDVWSVAQKNFEAFPNAKLVKGIVPDSLTTVAIEKVCYLSIDMNLALPEKLALEYFWPKLVPGAVVLLDDYGFKGHEEQRTVANDFAQKAGTKVLSLPTGQGLMLKPP